MKSAFGVEHGEYSEIEKFGLGGATKLVTGLGSKLGGAGNTLRRAGAANIRSSSSLALKPKVSRARAFLGQGQMKAGAGLKKVGGFAQKSPGATLGIGAAGAGGLGAGAAMAHTPNKQKLPQYR